MLFRSDSVERAIDGKQRSLLHLQHGTADRQACYAGLLLRQLAAAASQLPAAAALHSIYLQAFVLSLSGGCESSTRSCAASPTILVTCIAGWTTCLTLGGSIGCGSGCEWACCAVNRPAVAFAWPRVSLGMQEAPSAALLCCETHTLLHVLPAAARCCD